jgi:hypothetical protein
MPIGVQCQCGECKTCRRKVKCPTCGRLKQKKSIGCRGCMDRTLENHPLWKGGRTKNDKGYVLVATPGHPKARQHCSYVPEHVLVMESQLGRYLLPGENVHHKNGIRDDNRPENLELWVSSQPSGQRVSDLVEWAKIILARYT